MRWLLTAASCPTLAVLNSPEASIARLALATLVRLSWVATSMALKPALAAC